MRLPRICEREGAVDGDPQPAVAEQGAEASLRDVARRAGVGLGTLYRHVPTREALLEALLRRSFDALTERAADLEASGSPDGALLSWLREAVAVARHYSGVIAAMVAAIAAEESALHASCVTMRAAGTRLLRRAQEKGLARADIDGTDLFGVLGALAWIGDQPSLASRADHLFDVIAQAILTPPAGGDAGEDRHA
ncbi:TetR/AcrR family transcriptional regulator [Paracraurococcus lichenis]|uniref:TetR/AcrR family transcriptional regulator n=1 Tax=Paracraurococcus lichenis TaxID=3064888 RepID=A0ABT9DZF7_9PROT|nr:TetR/AcrR family transcriptional regulator [Paracraurococcus sp. LOR1-02]MDO9709285.1 TetR/AcrR family transcriptional regulator [Paracraurococcus sp. LOR1-02]